MKRGDAMAQNGRSEAIALLLRKQQELLESGTERLPQRSDFTAPEIVQIKAQLGAFPRALEAAGIKSPRDPDSAQKKQEKRIAAKRRRTAAKNRKQCKGEEVS